MLRLPNSRRSVHSVLAYHGPMTLAALSGVTGMTQERLRTHMRCHTDAYHSETIEHDGVKLRLWSVKGPIE